MDDRILLRGGVLRLRHHLAEAFGEREIHREGIAAVFELAFGKSQRGGQRAGLLLRAVADDAERFVDRRAFFERLCVPSGHDLRVIAALQRLHPTAAAFDDRFAAGLRRMREVGRVRACAAVFEEQRDLFPRQRPLPHLHHADFAVGEVAGEVRRGTSHFENMLFLIRLREVRLLRDLFAIEPQLRGAAADAQHGRVRFAVVHFKAGVDRPEPADVIHEHSAANEERLRIRRPLARRCAHREQRALSR